MKRKTFYIGIDTETGNSLLDEKGNLDLSQSLTYDIGWAIVDRHGKIYLKRSYVVKEIFTDAIIMNSAYYKEKIPQYLEDIKNGKRILISFLDIKRQFYIDSKKYKAKAVFAHNAYFDYKALNNTLRYLTGSKYRYFFPYGLEIWDTLKMSRDAIGKKKQYTLFCNKYNYKTNHKTPQNRFTAEVLYRYLSKDNNFMESHTGLEDVEIESKIFAYCLKSKTPIRKTLFNRKFPQVRAC